MPRPELESAQQFQTIKFRPSVLLRLNLKRAQLD
jgi:hypothetical protein